MQFCRPTVVWISNVSDQGIWNRAGRRSGGYRPSELFVAPLCPGDNCTATREKWELRITADGREYFTCGSCGHRWWRAARGEEAK